MTSLITTDLVRLGADWGSDKHDVIRALAAVVDDAGRATNKDQLIEDAFARESTSATGLPGGIAIPHCRTTGVDVPTLAFARLDPPVDFGAKDGPADLAFLIAAPAGGDIELFGQSMRARHFRMSRTIRRRCQIVFQNPFGALNPRLTIEKAMREPIELLEPDAARTIRPRLEEALGWVGLDAQYLERYPHQLSGGQRQRVCIARSLLSRPDLLICDEVVSALDASVQMQVLQTLKSLQEKLGFAMLFIGHDIQIVRWISDTIVVMNRGRIVEQGASSQILTAPRDAYTQRLIAAMPTPLEMASASV